jgi:hypothetical protein
MDITSGDHQDPLTEPPASSYADSADSTTYALPMVAAFGLFLILFLWMTIGWHAALLMGILCLLPLAYSLARNHWSSPFRIYFLVRDARNQVILEPRLYTQDDMMKLDSGQFAIRDWTLASGSYQPQSQDNICHFQELQIIFSSSVSRPMGSFWTKPKSLLWTVSGYGTDFTIQEGLISETGKGYWVEQHDFDERGKIMKLVQGYWDYDSNEFVGQFVDSNGTIGSYPTLLRQTLKVVDLPTAISAEQQGLANDTNNYVNFGYSKA